MSEEPPPAADVVRGRAEPDEIAAINSMLGAVAPATMVALTDWRRRRRQSLASEAKRP
jgi:hypothetical protein